jgi:hypothetical protein
VTRFPTPRGGRRSGPLVSPHTQGPNPLELHDAKVRVQVRLPDGDLAVLIHVGANGGKSRAQSLSTGRYWKGPHHLLGRIG